jgi:hypothetical protein
LWRVIRACIDFDARLPDTYHLPGLEILTAEKPRSHPSQLGFRADFDRSMNVLTLGTSVRDFVPETTEAQNEHL